MSEIGIKWGRIQLAGRAENYLDNIRFSDCTFEVTDYSEFNNKKYHGAQGVEQSYGGYPKIAYCDRVIFDNVEFQVKNQMKPIRIDKKSLKGVLRQSFVFLAFIK